MAKLYYGNGNCSIEGSDIVGVELRFRGAIEIEDKTDDSFAITHQGNGIMVFPNPQEYREGNVLVDLFDYTGELKIISVMAANKNAEEVPTTVHKVMDYSELLGNSEDITTKSEDLNQSNVSGRKVAKTALKQQYLENLSTSNGDYDLFFKNGKEYNGSFRVNLLNNEATTMQGESLFFKGSKPTKNEKSVPYEAIKQKRKKQVGEERSRIEKQLKKERKYIKRI